MSNHSFPTRPAHSFCRAARGSRGKSLKRRRSCARPINYLKAQLFHLPLGAAGTAGGAGIGRPRGAPPSPPISCWTRSSRWSMPTGASGTRARGGSDGGGRERACPMKAGHGGSACASCTDFFGLFLLACRLASARVLVMWDGYVERPWDLDSDRLWAALVACVQHTSRGLFACARAAARKPTDFRRRRAQVHIAA